MSQAVIAGTGMTSFGRFLERSVRSLATEAVQQALDDARVAPDDVGMIFFGNAVSGLVTGQETIRGQVALLSTGLLGKPIVNVDNACASSSSAAHMAIMAVRAGAVDVALAVGAERLTHEDKTVTFRAFASAIDLETIRERAAARGQATDPAAIAEQLTGGGTRSNFMDLYAATAREYMERTGATAEDFARVTVKSRKFGSQNPKAQFRQPVTVDEVLASRAIAPPLTLFMCSPVGDGAAAVVVCSAEYAARIGANAVRVRAAVLQSGTLEPPHSVERAVPKAYAEAGIGPGDLDVVELHDAAAPAELVYYEELGLCAPGDGAKLQRSGATDLGGRVPVNTGGGLLSRGHPIGATGCAQLVELCDQLRGRAGTRQVEGARLGLAQNGGGTIGPDMAAVAITILERS
jgi:acetyl-CoA acetyltransferase